MECVSRCDVDILLLQNVSRGDQTVSGAILLSERNTAGTEAGRAARGNTVLLPAGLEQG